MRIEAAITNLPRNLNANINPAFATGTPKRGPNTESATRYRYRVPPGTLNKDAHLRKDYIKEYVEKALQLHDERGGMPVVASPIWAPKTSSGKGGGS